MELFIGSDLEVVLYLNEGYDFGFFGSDFVVRVSLDSNEIVTNAYSPEKVVKFESELIFSSTKSNIKRMKTHKVPLRLDFCKVENNQPMKPFGYIILHLSGAQYLPKGGNLIIKEEVHKVCGLGKEARGYSPQVLLGLRIQDIPDELEPNLIEKKQKDVPVKTPKRVESIHEVPKTDGQLMCLNCYEIELDFKCLTWLTSVKDVHLRVHHGKGEVTWSAHEDIKETVPNETTVLENLAAKVTFLAVPNDLETFLKSFPPQITVCTLRNGRPVVLGRASLKIPAVNQDTNQSVTMKSLLTLEEIGTFTYHPTLTCKGPQILRELTNPKNDDIITDHLKSELEAWKEKERERLEQEFEERLQSETNRIEAEWSEKQKKLETGLSEKIKVCRELSDQLTKAMNMVKEKEIFMVQTQKDMEAGFQLLTSESNRQIESLRETVSNELKKKDDIITSLEDEILKLKKKSDGRNYDFTLEEMEKVLWELKKLHEQLESANKSKTFFKEQWTRVVRELHRLKSGDDNIQIELKLKKKELKELGLDHLIETAHIPGDY